MTNITSIKSILAIAFLLVILALSSPVQAEEQGLQSRSDLRLQKRFFFRGVKGRTMVVASLRADNAFAGGDAIRSAFKSNFQRTACPVKLKKRHRISISAALGARALTTVPANAFSPPPGC